jgi:glycosyltransferase involved in cell wall biosynthesis
MSAERGLVSVMVPVRDGAATIGAALRSVLTADANVEVVVVNDGSTDDTRDVVKSIDDDRVVLVDQPARGVNAARNTALDHMTGEWIAMLDADDEWLPGRLESLWACIDAGSGPLIADDLLIERQGARPHSLLTSKGLAGHTRVVSAAQFARWDLGLLQPTVRAEVVSGLRFPEHVRKSGDFPFWFRTVKKADGLRICPTLGYRHRRNPNSVSAKSPDLWIQSVAATAELLSTPDLGLTDSEVAALDERLRLAWGRYQRGIAARDWMEGSRSAAFRRLVSRPSIVLERLNSVDRRARVSWASRGTSRRATDLDLVSAEALRAG